MKSRAADRWTETKQIIDGALSAYGVPGCSVGVLHDGDVDMAGFGYSNIEKKTPVTADTLFQIGSITKTFTAAVAMKLVEDGKLDLHSPVRSYLPDFRVADESASAEVTPHHLLTHTAGWDGDLFRETGDGDDAIRRYIALMADREQLFPLGLFFSYNNAGFTLLGGILEAVTGRPMEELLRSLIVEPLGLTHVCFNAAEVITHDFAVGHHALPDGTAVARPWRLPRSVLPMGGIVTNAGDLLRYARCCLNRGRTETGKRMLKAQSVDRMHRAKAVISSEDRTSVGYSWMRRDLTKGCVLWHNGATNGQTARLTLLPERDFALSILTNGDRGGTLITEIERHILASYLQVTVESPREIDSTPQQLARYAGTAERPGSVFSMGMLGHHLVGAIENTFGFPTENDPPLPPSPPFRVGRCGADRLIILDGNAKGLPIDIYRNPEGDIASLRMGRMYRFTRSE